MTESVRIGAADIGGPWHLVGAGRIGLLAAFYLREAAASLTIVRPGAAHRRRITLLFDRADRRRFEVGVTPPHECGPVSRLVVACKTPYSQNAMARVRLADDATVIRLQNGIGSLDGQLAADQRLIEGVTTNAVMGAGNDTLRVVAENSTAFGGGPRPDWFDALAVHWPGLVWAEDIRDVQWRKLVANAVINPLTAIHDVPNGALLERRDLRTGMAALADEADALLARLDPSWPANSRDAVAEVASATAANTSSMRADVHAGTRTEIEAINGWLLRRADEIGLDLPTHRRIVAQVHALEPDA